jgi:hypothetical protein
MAIRYTFRLVGAVIIICGLFVMGRGLFGFTMRRPVVFPVRQFIWMFLLVIASGILVTASISVYALTEAKSILDSWEFLGDKVLPIIYVSLILFMIVYILWRQMTGYLVWGVDKESFRDGLVYALTKLNLPFEEKVSRYRLPSLDADLRVTFEESMGTAQMRIKPPQQNHRMKEIAAAMNEYYKETAVKINSSPFAIFLTLGIVMVILSISLFCLGTLCFPSHILY